MFEKPDPYTEYHNSMVFWFPILQEIRMRIPHTVFVYGEPEIDMIMEGKSKIVDDFLKDLLRACDRIGYPCFLRTESSSDKHGWKDTCYIEERPTAKQLGSRVGRLVEHSYMANIAGPAIPHLFWAVREMIPTKPIFHAFNDMPITREFRFFIRDGKIECKHPYWPKEAFEGKINDLDEKLSQLNEPQPEDAELEKMVGYIAQYFRGYWSVDMLQDSEGKWWCTDMAVGERSYHWPECKIIGGKDAKTN